MEKLSKHEINTIMSGISKLHIDPYNEEEFKQVKINEYYISYIISSYGRVFSLKSSITNPHQMKPQKIKNTGYMKVFLAFEKSGKYLSVHRLVALHFIDNKDLLPVVNHKDGNKENNCYWNLEWATQKDNIKHAYETSLSDNIDGENNFNNKFTSDQIIEVCELLMKNIAIPRISKETGVTRYEIYNILKKNVWKDIISSYDFSEYNYGKDINEEKEKKKKLHQVCKLLESNEYTMKEISELTGVSYHNVKNIFRGGRYKSISSQYDLTKFDKIKKYKSKK